MIYDRPLTVVERGQIETYLMAKYGAASPAGFTTGTVNVDVNRLGLAVASRNVTMASSHPGASPEERTKVAATNASGRATAAMPVGSILATVVDNGTTYEATGSLLQGQTITLAMNLPALPTTLSGRILATDGATPLLGATVAVGAKQSTTDANGDYRIDAPATGTQTITVTFQGNGNQLSRLIAAAVENTFNHTHTLAPIHIVQVVEAGTGAPIDGVAIRTCAFTNSTQCAALQSSDAQGFVRFVGQPTGLGADAGWHQIEATTPDGARASTSAYFTPIGPGSATLTFEPLGRLHGTVSLPGGAPAPGVAVTATAADSGVEIATTATADDGSYAFSRLGGHVVMIRASIEGGLIDASRFATVPVGGDLQIDLTLPVSVLDVTLLRVGGEPRSGQEVQFTVRGPRTVTRTTDAEGRVVVSLPAGVVRAVASTDPEAAGDIKLSLGESGQMTIQQGSHAPAQTIGAFGMCAGNRLVASDSCASSSLNPAQTFFHEWFGAEGAVNLFRTESNAFGTFKTGLPTFSVSLVYLRQQVFVPTSGSFARTTTWFTNVSDQPVTIEATASASAGICCSAEEGEGYFIQEGSYGVAYGSGGRLQNDEGNYRIDYTLEIPPHSTRAIVVFTTGAPSLLPSLLAGTASGAIDDLSNSERVSVANLTLPLLITTTIEGSARSADGDALSGATVSLVRDGRLLLQTITDENGHFSLGGSLPLGSYSLVILSGNGVAIQEVTVSQDGTINLGVVHPLTPEDMGSVRVAIEDGAGAPVDNLPVSAEALILPGLVPLSQASTDATGVATFEELIPGLHRLDTPLGAAYARVASGQVREVRLTRGPGPASVSGRVLLEGAPVVAAVVVGLQWDEATQRDVVVARGTTDAQGRYSLVGLREGEDVTVYAWEPLLYRLAIYGFHVQPGAPVTFVEDVILATDDSVGSLRIRGILDPGGAPASSYQARVEIGPFSAGVVLDDSGEATFSGLPGGNVVVVSVTGPAGIGRETALLISQSETLLNVPVGARVLLPVTLPPFVFSGTLLSEATNRCTPFCSYGSAAFYNSMEPWTEAGSAKQSPDGRELTVTFQTSPQSGQASPLRLTRRLFVPADGHFARIVEVIENTGTAQETASYSFTTDVLEPLGTVSEIMGGGVIDVSDLGAVWRSDQPTGETVGRVIRGANGLAPSWVNDFDYGTGRGISPTWHELALNPGQKIAFMSFVVFDRGPSADTVVDRVQALIDVTDPQALHGLTAADLALIVNFDVQVMVEAQVEGFARTSSGAPLEGAVVAIGRDDTLVAQGITGAGGAFSVAVSGSVGTYRIVFVSGAHFFEGTLAISENGTVSLGQLQALEAADRGSVRVLIEDGSGAPVNGLSLTARNSSFFGLDPPAEGTTDSQGTAEIEGLIPGLNRIDTPLGPAFARVVSGTEAEVRIQRGPGPSALSGRVTLNGLPVSGAVVVARQYDSISSTDVVVARATSDGLGRYSLSGLRDGDAVYIYAWDPDSYRHTSSGFYIEAGVAHLPGQDLPLATDVEVGSVLVNAFIEGSVTPAAGYSAKLSLRSWPFSVDLILDASGQVRVTGLPGGNQIIVEVTGPGGVGRELAVTTAQMQSLVDVPVGDRVALPATLGPFLFDGFVSGDRYCSFFCLDSWAQIGDAYEPWTDLGSGVRSADGRELTAIFWNTALSGSETDLRLTRRVFVPESGGFVRLVDVLENMGTDAATGSRTLSTRADAAGGTLTELLDGVVDGTDTAFVLQSDQATSETTGFIVRGTTGRMPSSSQVYWSSTGQGATFDWGDLSLEPGQKVAFMHFAVFDRGPGAATVVSRIQALVNLTDPDALRGLSPEDRALIVNWILP